MRRREFIGLVGGAAATWPLMVHGQQSTGIKRVGVLMGTAESDPDQKAMVSVFSLALADLGWNEGKNIHIEYRWAAGDTAAYQHLQRSSRASPQTLSLRKGHQRQRPCGRQRRPRRLCL
ncbi:MAG: hypothetical protein WCA54_11795 [Pseudolabrys sp.]